MARLHTATGEFVGLGQLPNGLLSFSQAIVRKLTGRIPREPWIPFAARKALERVLTPESIVWEIGAGFSTLWLADRVRHVTSIEASKDWHAKLAAMIAQEKLTNVDLRYEWVGERMSDFSGVADESLDLLFVDGGPRGQCLENGFSKVKSGGHIYLDNWDVEKFWTGSWDFPSRQAARITSAQVFVDYVPAQVGVNKGLLMRKA